MGPQGPAGESPAVEVEPAGENCEAGGVKITPYVSYENGEGAYAEPFFVCNGVGGATGPKGDTGPQGPQGDTGPQGNTGPKCDTGQQGEPGIPGLNGLNGKDGLAGPSGANGVNGQNGVTTIFTVTRVVMESPKQCSSRRVFTITLPRSYKGMSHVRVQTASTVKTLKINRAKRTVTIDLRGLKAGTYGVAIRSKGHKTLRRLYTVCNAGNVTAYNVPPAK